MKIKLDDNHTLLSDAYCCWIEETRISANGTEYQDRVSGYCNSLERVLETYFERKLLKADADTVAKLIKEIKAVKKEIKNMSKGLNALDPDKRISSN